jgi:hypothetical protein
MAAKVDAAVLWAIVGNIHKHSHVDVRHAGVLVSGGYRLVDGLIRRRTADVHLMLRHPRCNQCILRRPGRGEG